MDGSPAHTAGLRAEDLIVEVDGIAVEQVNDLQRLMAGELIGQAATMEVVRGGNADLGRDRPGRAQRLSANTRPTTNANASSRLTSTAGTHFTSSPLIT